MVLIAADLLTARHSRTMCGIVGYVGNKEAQNILLDGLKRLEYRGYDSAGIAVFDGSHVITKKSEGKLAQLASQINGHALKGQIGIGHTRWATHGKPSQKNSHPHSSNPVHLIHNGIIENYIELKSELPQKGKELVSETDTEVACHLLTKILKESSSMKNALRKTLRKIKGTYAFVILDEKNPDELWVAKKASPLVLGVGENENFVASDIPAILPYTNQVVFLENEEIARITKNEIEFFDSKNKKINKKPRTISWNAEMAEKGGYKHFMLKEIMEQPQAVVNTLTGRLSDKKDRIILNELNPLLKKLKNSKFPFFNRFYMVACGTSWHSAMAGKYYMESIAKIPVSVDTASEFRYREPVVDRHTLLLVISQSGETADTLACIEEAKSKGAKVISICNVLDSSIPRISNATLYTQAGPEIGVASTKAFTTQLIVLLLLALRFARLNKKVDEFYSQRAAGYLKKLPAMMTKILERENEIKSIAEKYSLSRDFYFIARGVHFPIALEGALKLKEISYIHAEGYSAGEMKHGPIALIEANTPVVAIAPQDRVCEKMISNIQEVQARGASVIALVTQGDKRFDKKCDYVFEIPKTVWYLTPILASLPLQLLAYHIADLRGADVDQPRNLAKSVTVE